MQTIIEVKNLTHVYTDSENKEIKALDGINLEIRQGEFVAVIGANGSGKSTLLRCINYLEEPTGGSIVIDGIPLTGEANINEIRKEVGMVFQRFNLFPHMTVLENLLLAPMKVRGISRSEAEQTAQELLIKVGLDDKANAYPDQLSGGQQQRICIARALAVKPEVLLMDEPTSALDPISTIKIEELATELKKNYTIVIVTHNMQQATRISDKTAFFLHGEIVEFDETQRIFSNPKEQKTLEYITGRFG